MVHTDNLGLVQSIEGCAECCIEPWHKDVHVLEKRRNAYIGWLRWRSVGKGAYHGFCIKKTAKIALRQRFIVEGNVFADVDCRS